MPLWRCSASRSLFGNLRKAALQDGYGLGPCGDAAQCAVSAFSRGSIRHPARCAFGYGGRRALCAVGERRARATLGRDAPHRRSLESECRRSGNTVSALCVPEGPGGIGLERGPKSADRLPLGRRRHRPPPRQRGRTRCARAGRHPVHGSTIMGPLQRASRTVPIVFVSVPIRSPAASSQAWRGRAATPPDFIVRLRDEREMA